MNFKELREKMKNESDMRVFWKVEPDAFIVFTVEDFATIHSKSLNKDEEVIYGTNVETGERTVINAYGMLKKRLQIGNTYGLYCVRKTDKGFLFRIDKVPVDELPF